MKNKQKTLKNLSESRKQRAKVLLEKSKPESIDENTYLVPSQNNLEKKYKVTHVDSYSCDCPDFQQRCKGKGLYCKHIKAILLLNKVKTAVEVQEKNIIFDLDEQKEICPYCNSNNLIKRGKRQNKIKVVQRFSCKDCNKRFVLEPSKSFKGNAKMICLTMDLFYKGNSLRDISDTFKQFYNLDIHHETIRRWIRKFSKTLNEYSKTLQPNISNIWNADETLVLTKEHKEKEARNKGYHYLWNVIDNKSKFILASECSGRSRKSKDAKKVFKKALEQNKKIPYQIITDKYAGYQDGVRKTFRNWGKERKVKHTSIVGKRKQVNNNAVENTHTHQKEFQKVRRGLKEVQDYSDGFKVFHNFIRKNVKDKTTPAEKCDLTIPEQNRWLGMMYKNVKRMETENKVLEKPVKV